MSFSPTEAAFEGFRVVRRRPMSLVGWSLFCIVMTAVMGLLMMDTLTAFASATQGLENGTEPTMADLERIGRLYSGMMAWAVPLGLVFGAVLNTAIARSVLKPEAGAFAYLRLGMDEVRVGLATLVVGIVMAVIGFVVFGVAGTLATLAVSGSQSALAGLAILVGLAGIGLLIWMAVRFSLVVPITFAERRIAPFESWTLTKGRTLRLLGMGVIAFAMSIVVSMLGGIVAMPLTMATGAGLQGLVGLEDASLQEVLRAAAVPLTVWLIINSILTAMQTAILYAPFSAAYRDIKGQPAA
ncbi:MAG: hypothetical protein EON91_11435 [Brevundimonas sp.]|uniref:hypothetical protein n=1 Tax=Brevundimonas sp. TaxID=1871086 RepID=UPI00122301D7|nr:hypothetical protein [Brevundimonas sp.]RZJ16873.1 MAG: hypothetical protein EON91_11435 [Brevundimonas sp.]